jgi:tRNA-intron endonuclease
MVRDEEVKSEARIARYRGSSISSVGGGSGSSPRLPRGKHVGFLVEDSIIVTDVSSSRTLYGEGFFGTPIGVEKPRGADFEAPLKLSLIEALYLVERGVLEVRRLDGGSVGLDELRRIVESSDELKLLYTVYRDLRDRGFTVRSGLKYGSDFTVYRLGPGLEHAPYVLHVYRGVERLDPTEIVRAGRLSHSVRKTFILAFPSRDGRVMYLMFDWVRF